MRSVAPPTDGRRFRPQMWKNGLPMATLDGKLPGPWQLGMRVFQKMQACFRRPLDVVADGRARAPSRRIYNHAD